MTKKEIIVELKELDKKLDDIYARRAELKEELVSQYGEVEADRLFDILHWTI